MVDNFVMTQASKNNFMARTCHKETRLSPSMQTRQWFMEKICDFVVPKSLAKCKVLAQEQYIDALRVLHFSKEMLFKTFTNHQLHA